MIRQRSILASASFQNVVLPLLLLSLLLYFVYHLIQGNRGLRSWYLMKGEVARKEERLAILQSERQMLERKVALLNPSSLCPDMLEERVREVLNFAQADEVIIFESQARITK